MFFEFFVILVRILVLVIESDAAPDECLGIVGFHLHISHHAFFALNANQLLEAAASFGDNFVRREISPPAWNELVAPS